MAEMNLGGQQPQADPISMDTTPAANAGQEEAPAFVTTPTTSGGESSSRTNYSGMTAEEITDSNKIKVTVADYKTPLVILFGPPACGKTMTLVRLTRYLRSKPGYKVEPIPSFRPQYDAHYQEMCGNFNTDMSSDDAAASTSKINFMLVRVSYGGKPLCQILEAPGEDYFNPEKPTAKFPNYVNAIISSPNRKIWAIMVEPADVTSRRMHAEARRLYVDKVKSLKRSISSRDKVMFVFNKIDETDFVVRPGVVKYGLAKQHTNFLYPGIFVPFTNVNPITKLWKPYNFDFVAIQTGTYPETNDGKKTFQEGSDVYPRNLWQFIMKRVRG